MIQRYRIVLLALLFATVAGEATAQAQKGIFALMNARIETITNGVISNGNLVIRNGLIEAIGANIPVPPDAEKIDCKGMTIYPGMIDAGTQLGLVEIGSLPETRDESEIGDITPQMKALTAINPNSVSIPVTRVNGVTTAIVAPEGGLFAGEATLVNLFGYTPQQMQVGNFRGVVLNFPSSARRGWWDERTDEKIAEQYNKALKKLNDTWEKAALFARIDSGYAATPGSKRTPEYVPEIQALVPAVRGEIPLMIEVNKAGDIDSAIAWVKEKRVRAIFTGVQEGWRVANKIAAAGIPCIVGPVLSIPNRASDRYDKAYANPGLMHKAGVTVALRSSETANARNLPYNAGYAAAYGMGGDEALKAITIIPATMFGVNTTLGSLEEGKQATLFVASGDIFEPATSVLHLFINGYNVPVTSRHTELYEEFIKREPGLEN